MDERMNEELLAQGEPAAPAEPEVPDYIARKQAEAEEKRNFQLPPQIKRFSWGAFLMPPIWGAGHGQMVTILFYPLWVFADSMFMSVYKGPNAFNIIGAILLLVGMFAVTYFYANTCQLPAYWRVRNKLDPDTYAKRERIWNIAMAVLAIAMIAFATYFNLNLYDGVHANAS